MEFEEFMQANRDPVPAPTRIVQMKKPNGSYLTGATETWIAAILTVMTSDQREKAMNAVEELNEKLQSHGKVIPDRPFSISDIVNGKVINGN